MVFRIRRIIILLIKYTGKKINDETMRLLKLQKDIYETILMKIPRIILH